MPLPLPFWPKIILNLHLLHKDNGAIYSFSGLQPKIRQPRNLQSFNVFKLIMSEPQLDPELQQQFDDEIKADEERTGMKCILLDGIDPSDNPSPTIEDLRAIQKIFVSENALSNIERIGDALDMVGRSSENDIFSMTTTRHSPEFFAIFRSECRKCSIKYTRGKFAECMDQLIGIILGLKDFPTGFMDTEDTEGGQRILNNILKVWKKAVISNHGLSEETISVLYDVLRGIGEEYAQCDYDFNPGVCRRRRRNRDDDSKNDDGDSDETDDDDQAESRSNRSRRRSRSSDDTDGHSDDNENDENPRPRQRRRISR